VFQPVIEIDLALNDDRDFDIGAGLVSTETALRQRYEVIARDLAAC
jgi:uncharacterized protein involved in copper resistance